MATRFAELNVAPSSVLYSSPEIPAIPPGLNTRICIRNSPLTTFPFSGFTMEIIGALAFALPSANQGAASVVALVAVAQRPNVVPDVFDARTWYQ